MKKTKFDTYLNEQLKDKDFAECFRRAGEAWDAEIERRVDDIRLDKVKGIPAEEVFAKLRDKYH